MTIKIALLTSCSMSRNFEPVIKIEDAPVFDTMGDLCGWWISNTKRESQTHELKTPGELYAGISFDTITEIAQDIGHDNIFIVTGGVGLVGLSDKILPYDFTSDKSMSANAPQHVTGERFIPHVWWDKINKVKNPVAALVKEYDIVVGALPKAFIKYLVRDLESLTPIERLDKVFLLTPRSSIGGIAKSIHDALVPYSVAYTHGLSANRYDKPQRVARKFIMPRDRSAKEFKASAKAIAAFATSEAMESSEEVDYDAMFKDNPRLLEGDDIGLAIQRVKALGLKLGGKHRFAGAWRGAKGQVVTGASKAEMSKAKKGLKALLETTNGSKYTDNEQLLSRLAIFVQAVREDAPDLLFTAKEISAWGKVTYKDDKDIQSAAKVSYVLAYHTKYLGLETVTVGLSHAYRVLK